MVAASPKILIALSLIPQGHKFMNKLWRARSLWASILLLTLFGPVFPALAQEERAPQRIQFRPGSRTAVVRGSLRRRTETVYLLPAQRGQRYTIRLTRNSEDCWFDLQEPDGEGVPEAEYDANLRLSGRFRETGDYRLIVLAMSQDAQYTLTVTMR